MFERSRVPPGTRNSIASRCRKILQKREFNMNTSRHSAGWKNESFRGYADYMQTAEFARAIERLIQQASDAAANDAHVCIMCAEAVPWRCHRSLIADALMARGIRAIHIMSVKAAQPHKLTAFARVRGDRVTYPAETLDFDHGASGD